VLIKVVRVLLESIKELDQAVRVAIQTIKMLGHEIVYIGCDSI
jgi:hypothetical protein